MLPWLSSEEKAIEGLRELGILRRFEQCIHCGSKRIGEVRRHKILCKDCRREWGIRYGSVLSKQRIGYRDFLLLLKGYKERQTVSEVVRETGISDKTVRRYFRFFRGEVMEMEGADKLRGEIEIDESYIGGRRQGKRGRGALGKVCVLGMLERGGRVRVSVVERMSWSRVKEEIQSQVERGSVVYTDAYRVYRRLGKEEYEHHVINHSTGYAEGRVHTNGIEGFWGYVKRELVKYCGLSKKYILEYLRELALVYYYGKEKIFEGLIACLSKKQSFSFSPPVALST